MQLTKAMFSVFDINTISSLYFDEIDIVQACSVTNQFKLFNTEYEQYIDHSMLSGGEVVVLLQSSRCDIDKCDLRKLSGYNWEILLSVRPELSTLCNWELLEGSNFAFLLGVQPLLSIYCDFSKFDPIHWLWLLSKQPQFSVHCNWGSMPQFLIDELLTFQPSISIVSIS